MNLLQLKTKFGRGRINEIARALKCSPDYLSQCAHGHRRPSPAMAKLLTQVEPLLKMRDLRPDFYP